MADPRGRGPDRSDRRVTITDVAAAAGASRSTTSRALTGSGYVSPEVRERVRKAAKSLGYVPDAMARGLKRRSSSSLGLLVSDLSNTFYAQLAAGASRRAKELGWTTLLADTQGQPAEELAAAQAFLELRVAGVIVTPVSAAISGWLIKQGIPAVEVDRSFGAAGVDAVAVDNFRGAQQATEHLIGLGHRRLGYIAGPQERTTTRHRLEGHRAALETHGIPVDDRLIVHGRYDRQSGYEATLELLRRDPSLTAVVAANDSVALGACAALREAGLRIPDDVSVAGFDDLPFGVDAVPSLTTVRLPLSDAGARAGRIAMGREEPPPGDLATVRGELMVRGSSGVPRG